MARIARGEWVATARELLDQTAGMTASERRQFLQHHREAGGMTPQAAQRAMQAYRWVAQRARKYGVELDEVVVAFTGVEALEKLEAARPDQAALIAADALRGRLTAREVIDMASIASGRRRSGQPSDWEIFLIDDLYPLLPPAPGSVSVVASEMSYAAQLLKVDVEWRGDDDRRTAIFFGPGVNYAQSEHLADVLPRVVAARTAFDEVIFFSWFREDLEAASSFPVKPCTRVAPLILAPKSLLTHIDRSGST